MAEVGGTTYGTPSLSYWVGLIAGVPGALALIPVCLAALKAMGVPIDGLPGTKSRGLAELVYLALLLWAFAGPLCLIVVTLASVKVSRGEDDRRRASELRTLAWATLASWGLLIVVVSSAFRPL